MPLTLHLSLRKLLLLFGAKIYPATAKFLAAFMRGTPQHSDSSFQSFSSGRFPLSSCAPLSPCSQPQGTQSSGAPGWAAWAAGKSTPALKSRCGRRKVGAQSAPRRAPAPQPSGDPARRRWQQPQQRQRPEPAAALSASGRRGGELGESSLPSERPARRSKTGWEKPESGNAASSLAPNDGAGWAGGAPESAGRAARCLLPFRRW